MHIKNGKIVSIVLVAIAISSAAGFGRDAFALRRAVAEAEEAMGWPIVSGTLDTLTTEGTTKTGNPAKIVVSYRYMSGGREFVGNHVVPMFGYNSSIQFRAIETYNELLPSVGRPQAVGISINPEDPSVSFIRHLHLQDTIAMHARSVRGSAMFAVTLGSVFLLLGVRAWIAK